MIVVYGSLSVEIELETKPFKCIAYIQILKCKKIYLVVSWSNVK